MILCATHPSDILVLNILGLLSLPQRVSVPTGGHQDQFVHAWSLPKSHTQSFQCWQPESFPFGSRTIGCTRHWCLWGVHASPKLSNNYSCSPPPSWRWNTVLTGSHWSVGGSDSLMERFTSSLLGQLGPLSTTSWSVPRCQLLILQSNIHVTFPFIPFEYLMRHLQSVPLIRSSFWPSLVPFLCCIVGSFEFFGSFVGLRCILASLCHLIRLQSFGRLLEWTLLLSVQWLGHFKDRLLTIGGFLPNFLHVYSITNWQSALGSKMRPYNTSTVLCRHRNISPLESCHWLWSCCVCGLVFLGTGPLLPTSVYPADFPHIKVIPLWQHALSVILTAALHPWSYPSLWICHSSSSAVTQSLLPHSLFVLYQGGWWHTAAGGALQLPPDSPVLLPNHTDRLVPCVDLHSPILLLPFSNDSDGGLFPFAEWAGPPHLWRRKEIRCPHGCAPGPKKEHLLQRLQTLGLQPFSLSSAAVAFFSKPAPLLVSQHFSILRPIWGKSGIKTLQLT